MIFFNGTALESIAPVMIEDIRVSPVQVAVTARQLPVLPGSVFVRTKDGTRTVAITFSVPEDHTGARERMLERITAWARTETPGRLEIPYHDGEYLECLCTNFPEPSMRQWWENKLRLVFTTYENPYFTSINEKSAACGAAFFVGGNAAPIMRIERTLDAAASAQAYSDGENTMTFSTIPAGSLVIDLNHQTAAVNGQSIMQNYAFGSSFLLPRFGAQTISGNGTIKWRERRA